MYGPESIERLRFISRLKSLGLTLEEIRDLRQAFDEGQTPAMLERLDAQLLRHLRQVEFKLGELTQLDADLRTYLNRIREKRT
jgi:DNA-binding transcriptional MerR regulator